MRDWQERISRAVEAAKSVASTPVSPNRRSTGSPRLDKHVKVSSTDLVVVAGRPGMAKSTLGLASALALASAGSPVAFFTTEMPAERVYLRLAGMVSGVNAEEPPDDGARAAVTSALDTLGGYPLVVVDTPGLAASGLPGADGSVTGVTEGLLAAGLDLGAVWVDYLGRLSDCDRGEQRHVAVGRAVRELKNLALRCAVPVFLLAQLNRQVEYRDDKRPQLSDLRDTGEIEQEADVVLGLYRHDYYFPAGKAGHSPELAGKLDIDPMKNRWGPTGTVIRLPIDLATGRVGSFPHCPKLGTGVAHDER